MNPKPDVLIHSVYDKNFLKYQCTRVCYTAENIRPDFTKSDYHIGFDYNDDLRYLRWPNFLRYYKPELFIPDKNIDEIFTSKKGFCAFVISNDKAQERINFFHELSKYRKVDSGGKALNNIGSPVPNKIEFIRNYKFTIAFENATYPGYTTEKIYEPFLVNSVPIYWGNPLVENDFNPKSFINANNFNSSAELIEYIKHVDNDDNLYKQYLASPCFKNNTIPPSFHEERLIEFFDKVFSNLGKVKTVANIGNYIQYYDYKMRSNIFKIKKRFK